LPNRGRQHPVLLDLGRWDEAGQTELPKASHLPKDRALRQTGFHSPLGRRLPEEHDGPNELVAALPRLTHEQGDLVPVVGGIDPRSWGHAARPGLGSTPYGKKGPL
jgi:hypothetical protein